MKQYLVTIVFFTVLVSLIGQMLPGERYYKIYGIISGMLLILVFIYPLLQIFGVYEAMGDFMQKEVLKPSYKSVEESLSEALEKQIKVLLSDMVKDGKEDGIRVKVKVSKDSVEEIRVWGKWSGTGQQEALTVLCAMYQLPQDKVIINGSSDS